MTSLPANSTTWTAISLCSRLWSLAQAVRGGPDNKASINNDQLMDRSINQPAKQTTARKNNHYPTGNPTIVLGRRRALSTHFVTLGKREKMCFGLGSMSFEEAMFRFVLIFIFMVQFVSAIQRLKLCSCIWHDHISLHDNSKPSDTLRWPGNLVHVFLSLRRQHCTAVRQESKRMQELPGSKDIKATANRQPFFVHLATV